MDKKFNFKNKRKSETLTLDDIMLNDEIKFFSKIWTSNHLNRKIKSNTFLLVFLSLSLEGTKGAEVTQLDYQHL